jgi:hypothetical protein
MTLRLLEEVLRFNRIAVAIRNACGTTLYLVGFPEGKTPRVINNAGTRT